MGSESADVRAAVVARRGEAIADLKEGDAATRDQRGEYGGFRPIFRGLLLGLLDVSRRTRQEVEPPIDLQNVMNMSMFIHLTSSFVLSCFHSFRYYSLLKTMFPDTVQSGQYNYIHRRQFTFTGRRFVGCLDCSCFAAG